MVVPLRRIGRLSLEELCSSYENEDVHTEYVTKLALDLFDRTREWLGLPARSRRLLEAAGRLHDVGYSVDPVHHVHASAEIVQEEGIKGFRKLELDQIVQIMVNHSGKWRPNSTPKPLLQLAAFLRIGDGLDYSHAQTATIVGVRRTRRVIHVTVRSDAFPPCLIRANRKADLWRAVFPYDIQFVAAPPAKNRSAPLVRRDTPVLEAARRLLWIQFKTILANLDDAVQGQTSEPVHRIRVATRRMRSLLRAFRKHLPAEPRKEMEAILDDLSEELAPVRDLDVWLDLLQSYQVRQLTARSRLWPAYLRHHVQRRQLVHATVRRSLRGPHFAAQRLKMNRLLRTELPQLIKLEPCGSLPGLAATQFRKAWRRALQKSQLRHSRSAKKLHRLRIGLRKARYWAEFFNPVLGVGTAKLTKRLRQTEQILGRIHDLDMATEHLAHEGPTPPRALALYLEQERAENLGKLEKTWRRLADPLLQKRVEQELDAAHDATGSTRP
ncbi:MAG TPA: CHAD domain-containing protein [Verrucomicrobiae bacterium]|nr:CHAD domain-containing protein [Verrucomicrobiae bacterium]